MSADTRGLDAKGFYTRTLMKLLMPWSEVSMRQFAA